MQNTCSKYRITWWIETVWRDVRHMLEIFLKYIIMSWANRVHNAYLDVPFNCCLPRGQEPLSPPGLSCRFLETVQPHIYLSYSALLGDETFAKDRASHVKQDN